MYPHMQAVPLPDQLWKHLFHIIGAGPSPFLTLTPPSANHPSLPAYLMRFDELMHPSVAANK
jgi:hypothetical protein